MRRREDHAPRDPHREYEPSRLPARLIGPLVALVLAASLAASALFGSPEPLHSALVGPLEVPPPAATAVRGAPAAGETAPPAVHDLTEADPGSQGLDPEPDDPWESFAAVGYGGHLLYVVPELEMLAVITATHEGKGAEWDRETFAILRDSIFGAALRADIFGAALRADVSGAAR